MGVWECRRVGVSACRRRAPAFAGYRAASRKSKSYVGQAVLVGRVSVSRSPLLWRGAALQVGRSGGSQPPKGFREDRRLPRTSQRSAVIPYKWNGTGGRPADRAKYTRNRSREPLAANLLICYLIKRFPASGVRTEDICGYLPPPPLFLKP